MREADYIVGRTIEWNEAHPLGKERIRMSGKRLQKILFFSYVNYLLKSNGKDAMFDDAWYAWESGPVIPNVYFKFVKYQNGVMWPIHDDWQMYNLQPQIKQSIDEVLDLTWNVKDVQDLIAESHIENGPWDMAQKNNTYYEKQIIPRKSIFDFYKGGEWRFINVE